MKMMVGAVVLYAAAIVALSAYVAPQFRQGPCAVPLFTTNNSVFGSQGDKKLITDPTCTYGARWLK